MVSHAGRDVVFDWSNSTSDIKWAAFYSDCEHEIRKVTAGTRVTLTYNLYARWVPSNGSGYMDQGLAPVDVKSLPFYQVVRSALENMEYMKEGRFHHDFPFSCRLMIAVVRRVPGGTLGVLCVHAYPARTDIKIIDYEDPAPESSGTAPVVLKGTDLALFTVFKALGMTVKIRSILDSKSLSSNRRCPDDEWKELGMRTRDAVGGTFVTSAGGHEDYTPADIVCRYGSKLPEVTWLKVLRPVRTSGNFVHLGVSCRP